MFPISDVANFRCTPIDAPTPMSHSSFDSGPCDHAGRSPARDIPEQPTSFHYSSAVGFRCYALFFVRYFSIQKGLQPWCATHPLSNQKEVQPDATALFLSVRNLSMAQDGCDDDDDEFRNTLRAFCFVSGSRHLDWSATVLVLTCTVQPCPKS